MEATNEPDRIPKSGSADDEAALRQRLFELDSAMDAARKDPDSAWQLGALAEERDAIKLRLQALDPPDADLGYQRRDDGFSKVQSDGTFIASPGETGGLP